jgi:hypothetical protein
MIPADAIICSHCQTHQIPEPPAKPDRVKPVMAWVGYLSALIALCVTLFGGVRWIQNYRQEHSQVSIQIAVAQSQSQRGENEAAFRTYQEILKSTPRNQTAADGQVDAVMLWLEDFHAIGDDAAKQAATKLDEIFPVLDAALVRATGSRNADIQAHIGWAHWLNQKIAEREFGSAPQQNFQAALATEPTNVYANAMLANILLQTGSDTKTALAHFQIAESTGRVRPLVRAMELGGMIYNDDPGIRAATIRVANSMRKNNEPLDEEQKSRIISFCYNPIVTSRAELWECLSAVPEQEAWATYVWLDDTSSQDPWQTPTRDYIFANLLEVSGKKSKALAKFRTLQHEVKGTNTSLETRVAEAIKRLS